MLGQFRIFFSNQLEILYQQLKQKLFEAGHSPFNRRLVVVYGLAVKSWLMLRMAQDPDLQVAMGLEIIYLHQAFEKLLQEAQNHPTLHFPTSLEMALAIEKELLYVLKNFRGLNSDEQVIWLPLIHYLKLDPASLVASPFLKLSRKVERRLIALSQQIAKLFQDYGRYGGTALSTWEKEEPSHWQHQLWKKLFQESSGWSYPCREFQQPMQSIPYGEMHFFSISFITSGEFQFLQRLAASQPVYYYLLSPCAFFWSDIRSDKEAAYLQAFWQQRLGHSPKVAKLEELLRDRNPLLANFGRLGREMACQIEESEAQVQAHYLLPSTILQQNSECQFVEDLTLLPTDRPLTLLQAVQADILLMRNPQGGPPIDLARIERSIQVHMAPNRQREVQILYHNLLQLIDESKGSICPQDIIVMAPQIMDYVPYIQSLFGSQESVLDFQILDLGMRLQSESVQGFLHLLTLAESRWDVAHLLQLFSHPAFQRRHQLTVSDYALIQEWIEQVGIRWGEDCPHRNELLERNHCQKGMVDETAVGTWDYGLTRLLLGLTTAVEPNTSSSFENLPYDKIDFSQSELLGKWIRLLHALRDDLSPVGDYTQMTIDDWMNYFICLIDSYFMPDAASNASVEDFEDLKNQFEILRNSAKSCREAAFSFQSVKSHLMGLLEQRGMTFREHQLQTIRFCSMMPLRSIPAKVVALLGMQEGSFPRSSYYSSLNLLSHAEGVSYQPTSVDYDRYLFLEAVQSAKEYLLISYPGYSVQDGKELQPSLVIEELVSYLNKYYTMQGQKFSALCMHQHPFHAFDERYFQPDSPIRSYSFQDYQAARVYYKMDKHPPHCFVRTFSPAPIEEPVHDVMIDLKQLIAVARNPVKFYLNHVLDIYLEREEDRQIKNEEDFTLSSLDKYILKQSALKVPLEEVLKRAEKEGRLPFGLFKSVACKKLKEEIGDLQERLQKHRLQPQDLFQIEFSTGCSKPVQLEEDHWMVPAVSITYPEGKKVQIVGKLSNVTPKGLLMMSKGSLVDSWKAWPQFLLYQYAAKFCPQEIERQMIMTHAASPKRVFFDDPEPYLKKFLSYYSMCEKSVSPLVPEWIPFILNGDVKGLESKIRSLFTDSFGDYQSYDVKWVLNREDLPDGEALIQDWQPHAKEIAGDLLLHWHKAKGGEEE